jgi:hypothetical protein
MLVCNVSLRPPRAAIAADVAEADLVGYRPRVIAEARAALAARVAGDVRDLGQTGLHGRQG